MTNYPTIVTVLVTALTLTACGTDSESSSHTDTIEQEQPTDQVNEQPTTSISEVVRTWSIYSRSGDLYDAETPYEDWAIEAVPDVNAVSPVQAPLGAWSCHTLGIQHAVEGWEQVTLWCSVGDTYNPWQVTTICKGTDTHELMTLIDSTAGKYYELVVRCEVEST